MGVTILFFSGLAVIAVWWLSKHRLASKPWLEQGAAGEFPGELELGGAILRLLVKGFICDSCRIAVHYVGAESAWNGWFLRRLRG